MRFRYLVVGLAVFSNDPIPRVFSVYTVAHGSCAGLDLGGHSFFIWSFLDIKVHNNIFHFT